MAIVQIALHLKETAANAISFKTTVVVSGIHNDRAAAVRRTGKARAGTGAEAGIAVTQLIDIRDESRDRLLNRVRHSVIADLLVQILRLLLQLIDRAATWAAKIMLSERGTCYEGTRQTKTSDKELIHFFSSSRFEFSLAGRR